MAITTFDAASSAFDAASSAALAELGPSTDWQIAVPDRIEVLERPWRDLEARGLASAFQGYDFAKAWYDHAAAAQKAVPCPAIVRDASGAVAAIFPFERAWRGPLSVLSFIGSTHVTYNLPLVASHAAADALRRDATRIVKAIAAEAEADIAILRRIPAIWGDEPSAVAGLRLKPSADRVFLMPVGGTYEGYLKDRYTSDDLKGIRRKDRRLAELGEVTIETARDPSTAKLFLDTFFTQKRRFFAAHGLPDPFAVAGVQDFYRACFVASAGRGDDGTFRLFALRIDGTPIAVEGCIVAGGRASSLFTAYDPSHPGAKFSPGAALHRSAIREFHAAGLTAFDLGVGFEPYKLEFCKLEERLSEAVLAVTPLGAVAAAAFAGEVALRRLVKDNPRLARWAKRIRGWRHRSPAPAAKA